MTLNAAAIHSDDRLIAAVVAALQQARRRKDATIFAQRAATVPGRAGLVQLASEFDVTVSFQV